MQIGLKHNLDQCLHAACINKQHSMLSPSNSLPSESIPNGREPYRRVPLGRVQLNERRLDEVQ